MNTRPLLFGIRRSPELLQQMELVESYPARIAAMLLNNEIDVGLVPVAIIPRMKEHHIIPDYCIGAEHDVASVCLFSETPVDRIKKVLLDPQSRTSVNLCRILLKHYWKTAPLIEDAGEDVAAQIGGDVAAVIIGDRALEQRKKATYIYDLAGAWRDMTGLPFVFAAWVANKKLPGEFISLFNEMNGIGVTDIASVLKEVSFEHYDLEKYYTQNISYALTQEKLKAMNLFLSMMA